MSLKFSKRQALLCPYKVIRDFLAVHPCTHSAHEQFFVFADNSPVKPSHIRLCLKKVLRLSGFNMKSYTVHSLRAG